MNHHLIIANCNLLGELRTGSSRRQRTNFILCEKSKLHFIATPVHFCGKKEIMSLSRTWPFAAFGVLLASYALYVEHKVAHKSPEEEFSALCDIEQIGASCRYVNYILLFPRSLT
jgi:hypothetical protein